MDSIPIAVTLQEALCSFDPAFPEAQFLLGFRHLWGYGVPQDDRVAFLHFTKAAEAGLPCAQFTVGKMLHSGKGVLKDVRDALSWYEKAAGKGHVLAMVTLGILLRHGSEVDKDEQRGFQWIVRAAQAGDASALYTLAQAYERGEGTKQSDVDALRIYSKLADEHGDPLALRALAEIHRTGKLGVLPDPAKDEEYRRLARAREAARDELELAGWKERAANNDVLACKYLAEIYEKGYLGVAVQKSLAAFWLARVASITSTGAP